MREKLTSWTGETVDLGVRGCRIALKRPVAPGALLQLAFEAGPGAEPLVVLGQVAWASRAAPLVAGIKFLAVPREAQHPQAGFWLDRLVAVQLRRAAVRGPAAVAALGPLAQVRIRLCGKHDSAPSVAEQAVLTLARGEGSLAAAGFTSDRLGAVASLLERGVITVALGGAAGQPALTPPQPVARIDIARRAPPRVIAAKEAPPCVIAPPPAARA